jgi:hypothetical protein
MLFVGQYKRESSALFEGASVSVNDIKKGDVFPLPEWCLDLAKDKSTSEFHLSLFSTMMVDNAVGQQCRGPIVQIQERGPNIYIICENGTDSCWVEYELLSSNYSVRLNMAFFNDITFNAISFAFFDEDYDFKAMKPITGRDIILGTCRVFGCLDRRHVPVCRTLEISRMIGALDYKVPFVEACIVFAKKKSSKMIDAWLRTKAPPKESLPLLTPSEMPLAPRGLLGPPPLATRAPIGRGIHISPSFSTAATRPILVEEDSGETNNDVDEETPPTGRGRGRGRAGRGRGRGRATATKVVSTKKRKVDATDNAEKVQ